MRRLSRCGVTERTYRGERRRAQTSADQSRSVDPPPSPVTLTHHRIQMSEPSFLGPVPVGGSPATGTLATDEISCTSVSVGGDAATVD